MNDIIIIVQNTKSKKKCNNFLVIRINKQTFKCNKFQDTKSCIGYIDTTDIVDISR